MTTDIFRILIVAAGIVLGTLDIGQAQEPRHSLCPNQILADQELIRVTGNWGKARSCDEATKYANQELEVRQKDFTELCGASFNGRASFSNKRERDCAKNSGVYAKTIEMWASCCTDKGKPINRIKYPALPYAQGAYCQTHGLFDVVDFYSKNPNYPQIIGQQAAVTCQKRIQGAIADYDQQISKAQTHCSELGGLLKEVPIGITECQRFESVRKVGYVFCCQSYDDNKYKSDKAKCRVGNELDSGEINIESSKTSCKEARDYVEGMATVDKFNITARCSKKGSHAVAVFGEVFDNFAQCVDNTKFKTFQKQTWACCSTPQNKEDAPTM